MSKSFKTFLKHTAKDFHNQSVNPPVVRASTIIFKSMRHIRKTQMKAQKNPVGGHFDYGRQGTSTTYILQKILTKLEESYHVFTTPTGFGSVFLAIFSVVRPGDEMLVADPVYSPTRILTENFLKELGSNLPFISENGSVINGLNLLKKDLPQKLILSRNKNELLNVFNNEVPKKLSLKCKWIYLMNKENQSNILGLSRNNLIYALDRKFTIPFVFEGTKNEKIELNKILKIKDLTLQEGGRVINLCDNVSKAKSMQMICIKK